MRYLVANYGAVRITVRLHDEDPRVAIDPSRLGIDELERLSESAELGSNDVEISREAYLRAAGFEEWG
jgi:hypothetical protein